MGRFILKRLVFSLPLLLGITFLTFLFIQIAPGDFLDKLRLNPQVSQDAIELYEQKFHLDKPLMVQYFVWLKNILKGDFGYSFSFKAKVFDVVSSRLFNTLILSLSSLIFTWIFVIPLGVIAALKRNKFTDRFLSFSSYIGISVPSFFFFLALRPLSRLTIAFEGHTLTHLPQFLHFS